MFTAMVLACNMVTGACAEFIDNRGPYDKAEDCMARVEEMISFIPTTGFIPRAYKCDTTETNAKSKGSPT